MSPKTPKAEFCGAGTGTFITISGRFFASDESTVVGKEQMTKVKKTTVVIANLVFISVPPLD